MSYCRWSEDSDGYCYEDCSGGYRIHVAENRLKDGCNYPKDLFHSVDNLDKFIEEYDKYHVAIKLPHAGEVFTESNLDRLLERLLELRDIGYIVPEHVIEEIRNEIANTN